MFVAVDETGVRLLRSESGDIGQHLDLLFPYIYFLSYEIGSELHVANNCTEMFSTFRCNFDFGVAEDFFSSVDVFSFDNKPRFRRFGEVSIFWANSTDFVP